MLAEQVRTALSASRSKIDSALWAKNDCAPKAALSRSHALMGKKNSALRAERRRICRVKRANTLIAEEESALTAGNYSNFRIKLMSFLLS